MHEEITTYLKWQKSRTGRSLTRTDLLMNLWLDHQTRNETVNWSLLTGKRRTVMNDLAVYVSFASEDKHDAALVDALIEHIDGFLKTVKQLKRALKMLDEATQKS